MRITPEEVKKLSALSRIDIRDDEVPKMQGDMSAILGYIVQINEAVFGTNQDTKANIKDIVEDDHQHNIWREDNNPNSTGENTEKLLSVAPDSEDNYIKVKKIL